MSIPGSGSPLLLATTAAAADAGYVIPKSLRFNREDSAHLSRTPSSAGNSKTFTFSCWYKKTNKSATGVYQAIFDANNGSDYTTFYTDDDSTDLLRLYIRTGGVNYNLKTTQVFRDFSAWMHIVVAVDTTQSTAANRIKLYINGSQVTDFRTATYPPQNSDLSVNKTAAHFIGGRSGQSAFYLNGYLADIHFIDGQALASTDFGETRESDGVWVAKEYSGTYGTNGFHLNFSDSSTNEALGFDSAPTTPDPDPKKGMDVITYTGTGAVQTIGGLGFEPDLVWLKRRDDTGNHNIQDVVRGASTYLQSDYTGGESSSGSRLQSFNPDGFTLTSDNGGNTSGGTYVAWCWKAGGAAVANSDGSINSQVSASTEYGFSVVSYTGTGSNATVGHGLSSAPKWIIVKDRSQATGWSVYHDAIGTSTNNYIELQSTGAAGQDDTAFQDTAPTSSVFSIGTKAAVNESGDDFIAYCWSEVSGFSKFSSFTGSGSTAQTITTGFKPTFVILRSANQTANWVVLDSERGSSWLEADGNAAENSNSNQQITFGDDSFTVSGSKFNADGQTMIYMAFADRPGNHFDVNNIVTNEGLTTSKTQFDIVTYSGTGSAQQIGGPSYSAHATNPSSYNGSAANLFDGSISTSWQNTDTSGSTYASVDLTRGGASSGVAFTTSFEMYGAFSYNQVLEIVHAGGTHTYNGNPGGSGAWVDFASSLTSPVTTVRFKDSGGTGTPSWNAIRVDNEILIDGDDGPGLEFQPDFVWIKVRSAGSSHRLFDSVRGAGKHLLSDGSSAEETHLTSLSGFTSNGFTLGANGEGATNVNQSNGSYVAWCWKAGGTAVSNTDGSITSSVSANAQYGFSIVSYTGTGSASTVGHGLSTAPKLILVKSRDAAHSWQTFQADVGSGKSFHLNTGDTPDTSGGYWNNTDPTSSVFTIGNSNSVNQSGDDYIAYCFANVPGYQRIGSYTGNGSSTGPVIVTGFKPRFLIIKQTDGTNGWFMWDSERDPSNPNDALFSANASNAEQSQANHSINFLNNGFQPDDSNGAFNGSGNSYIYWAIGDDEIGSDEDCLVDVPNAVTADADATDTTGGYQRGNYATLNPLDQGTSTALSNGNLDMAATATADNNCPSTIGMSSGKWYFEVEITFIGGTGGGEYAIGLGKGDDRNSSGGQIATSWAYESGGNVRNNGSNSSYTGDGYTTGDVLGAAFDADNGTLAFYKNGVNQGTAATGLSGTYFFLVGTYLSTSKRSANFGQRPFKYPIPDGYAALNTTALPDATIADGSTAMDVVLWTGDNSASTRAITSSLAFSPDLVWGKERSEARSHQLYDAVRGAGSGKDLTPNANYAEGYDSSTYGYLDSFDTNGFTVAKGSNSSDGNNYWNKASQTYVAWCWDAGSSTVSNTDGNFTTNVRVNQTAGFSIVEAPSMTLGVKTLGHGLNSSPDMIWVKRASGGTEDWYVFHSALGTGRQMRFNKTDADQSTTSFGTVNSSVFSYDPNSGDHISFCWTAVSGYSAFGSYEGNGSTDGPFVYTGFRPAFILFKKATAADDWIIFDTTRDTFNRADKELYSNLNKAEEDNDRGSDILSNGFKIRTTNGKWNTSGATYIYAAFAENPFQANGGLAR